MDGLWGVDGGEHWDEASQHHEGITGCLYGGIRGSGFVHGMGRRLFLSWFLRPCWWDV